MYSPADLRQPPLRIPLRRVVGGMALITLLAMPALAAELAQPASAPATAADSALFAVNPAPACANPLCYLANSMSATRNHMVMINPDIVDTTRGVSHITADRAEENGNDIGNSEWVLSGHVRADMPEGQLRAETATIHIVDRQIASITAQGMPARFQRPAQTSTQAAAGARAAAPGSPGAAKPGLSSLSITGHANSITYDAQHGRVQFKGDSSFSDGCNDITSQLVTYSMSQQSVQAGEAPGSNGRVHGVIRNTRPGSSASCTQTSGPT